MSARIAENDDDLMNDDVLVKTLRAGGYINGTGRYLETLYRAADRIIELKAELKAKEDSND